MSCFFCSLSLAWLQVVSPEDQFLHPGWTGNRADGNDIGLLRLRQMPSGIGQPMALAQAGRRVLGGPLLGILKYSDAGLKLLTGLAVVPTGNCKEMRGKQAGSIIDRMFCGFVPQLNDSSVRIAEARVSSQSRWPQISCLGRDASLGYVSDLGAS